MGTLVKILVVEDEMIIGAKISMQLTSLGYEVTGILPRGEEAILHAKENKPDIILLDINLKGKLDGIETAIALQQQGAIPIIYLTANSDEATFNRAKSTKPYAFIAKPFKQLDLQRAIELTISRMAENTAGIPIENKQEEEQSFILSDRIFIRHKEKMIKIMLAEILYMEADRNYSRIFTSSREYLLSTTLKTIEEKMSMQLFMRIHRSYLINITHVDEVAESHVMIGNKAVPLGTGMREQLMHRMQTL
ncbi:MAG: LytTR family transcriptional regulator [Ferruginibacter sp.]|uniref:response regulator n=1 Tax=Ferruginibacter sp. TaxID=1940288 RepID=UPI00265A9EF4|nr:response regulator [Ferruginibacter sp.]MDB5278011.1 LytTR family transcriptional regulator [Ferruginibacter sp.]